MYYYHIYLERDWGGLAIIPSRKKKINIKYDFMYSPKQRYQSRPTDNELKFLNFIKINHIQGWIANEEKSQIFPVFIRSNKYCTRYKIFLESFLNNGGEQTYTLVSSNMEESLFWNMAWGKITDSWSFELIAFVTLSRFFKFFPSCVSSKISN